MSQFPLWKPLSASLPRNEDVINSFARTLAADSNSSSPIVAQRLDPEVMPVFVRDFPLFDVIEKVPANGLSHTFLQQTAFSSSGNPHTIAETGTVSDDANTYLRKTTNIALFAERRGVTIKAMLAGMAAGGPSADLMARELKGGIQTVARDAQNEFLRFTETYSASTGSTDPNGQYDVNGVNGLRYVCYNQSPPENTVAVDCSSPPWTDQRVLLAFRSVCSAIWDKGGQVDLAIGNTQGANMLFRDQVALIRYIKDDKIDLTPGLRVKAVETDQGLLPFLPIPGNAVGTYTISGHTYTDIYVVWTDTLQIPYLGAPEPTVLRIPIGTDGTLRELAIPFALYGLACLAPQYVGRVQIKLS